MAHDVIARWRAWVSGIRPEMSSQVLVDRHGVSVRGCWAGDLAVGRAMLDAWRAWSAPVHDDWIVRATDELEAIAATTDGTIPQGITNEWLSVVRDEVVDVLIDAATGASGAPAVAWAGVRHAGGAIRSRCEAAVNGQGRSEAYLVELCGGTTATRHATRERLRPYVTGATMLNLVDGDERRRRTPTSFGPEQFARLRAVKTSLDPTNRFRHGLAVEPITVEPPAADRASA
jgi:FAD/FMN-containing dehydrogenase